jgi:hypothetical protein
MCYVMEQRCSLHSGHDRKPRRGKLRREFLDSKPKSGDQQRRVRKWPALDRNGRLFELFEHCQHPHWIDGVRNDQYWNDLEVVGSACPCRLQR